METDIGYTITTTHGVANCEHCLYAADWAVTQVMTIGTAVGFDRHRDERGVLHKATARQATNEGN